MADGIPTIREIGGLIPNFWFDLIGRVVPGSYLIFGLFALGWDAAPANWVRKYLAEYETVGPAVGLVLFLLAAYFAGLLLGALGHGPAQWLVLRWRQLNLNLLSASTRDMLRRRFIPCETSKIAYGSKQVRNARDYCSLFIWNRKPELAVLFSRWDAEALAGSSIAWTSLLLFVICVFRKNWNSLTIVLLALIFLGGALQCWHSSRKAIDARMEMYSVIHDNSMASG